MLNILKQSLINNKSLNISGLTSSSITYITTLLSKDISKSFLLVVDDSINLAPLQKELEFWQQELESKSYISYLPSKDEKQRLNFLYSLVNNNKQNIICTNSSDLIDSTLSKKTLLDESFTLKTRESIKREHLISKLVDLGYTREDEIVSRGEFSIRGEIVDIWSENTSNPLRLLFDEDKIECISFFDVDNQRSTSKIKDFIVLPFKEKEEVRILDYFDPKEYIIICLKDFEKNYSEFLSLYLKLIIEPLSLSGIIDFDVHNMVNFQSNFDLFLKQLDNWLNRGNEVTLISYNDGENKRLQELLKKKILNKDNIKFAVGFIRDGFIYNLDKKIFITDREIFNRYDDYDIVDESTKIVDAFKESKLDYKPGDYIIHSDYGIGKFLGLKRIRSKSYCREARPGVTGDSRSSYINEDYISIEFDKGDKLYVPVYNFDLIHRYVAADDFAPRLSSLGKEQWKRMKRKVYEKIREMARTIVNVEAKRKVASGITFEPDPIYENQFRDSFIYEETKDQKLSIQEVLADMESSEPMERLICGDVGYGKTEVAMRGAFRAVVNNKQVAMLVPTTILARQHHNTFKERFADYPLRIELISRFVTPKKQKQILEDLALGKVDILIGTHGLLGKSVSFPNLGLVIIDEEHRFGVKAKEKLKKLRERLDVLMLTATPIPRTLSMALNGLRKISVIETPPPNRKSIKTTISLYDKTLIRDAINFEIEREGQVFYVYNDISTIEKKRKELLDMLENKSVEFIHGRMHARDIEKRMLDFLDKKIDILLTTTIIESGIDIPAVNMMIIEDVDRFGLAQLYQLRGRVGRGDKKAFCYFFYRKGKKLTENAIKRLKALQEFENLGAGFKLALRDLEIRGTGNILGKEQHGFLNEIGLELYSKLLNKAINKIRTGEEQLDFSPEINIPVNAYFPDTYIKDPSTRITFYKSLLNIDSKDDIYKIKEELIDRFGKIPDVVNILFDMAHIRFLCKKNFISKVYIDKDIIRFTVLESRQIDVIKLLNLVSKFGFKLKFETTPKNNMVLYDITTKDSKSDIAKKFLQRIGEI